MSCLLTGTTVREVPERFRTYFGTVRTRDEYDDAYDHADDPDVHDDYDAGLRRRSVSVRC